MSVVDLAAAREARRPHVVGPAFCRSCDHEWEATAPYDPAGTAPSHRLECPSCHTMNGMFKFDYLPQEAVLTCHVCDNQLFYVTRQGNFCPRCGHYEAKD